MVTALARWIASGAAAALLVAGTGACADDGEDSDDGNGYEDEGESDDRTDGTENGDDTDVQDDEASVEFEAPEDGSEVPAPVELTMDADGVTIEPAGQVRPNAGHLHVMVDVGCVTPGETIPTSTGYNHFGDGSTSAELDLEPGEHQLCLQLGDGAHVAQDLTDEIRVTVPD